VDAPAFPAFTALKRSEN